MVQSKIRHFSRKARLLQTTTFKSITGRRALFRIAPVFLLLLFLPRAGAQLYTASVTGTVTDPSGAVVVSAHVTLVDVDKGYTYTATTNSEGRYLFRQVPPGMYQISVEMDGFQTERKDGIKLDVNLNATVDFSLKVGKATEVIEVKGATVQIQTQDAVTGQVVDRKFMNDLPLVGRRALDLAYLAPGVVPTNLNNAKGNINFNSNGSRNMTADVLVDGATATNFEQNSGIQNLIYAPSVDAIEEFKVQQSNFSAEFGFAGATVINAITRSGTNQYHGSLYEFWRNQILDANNWFNNANGSPIASLRRNNFGGTIGGPIKKDKTFFFFDYEGLRARTADSNTLAVPTLCERGDGPCPAGTSALGNFSEICTLQGFTFNGSGQCIDPTAADPVAGGASGQLWDPYTGTFSNSTPNGNGPGAVRSTFIPFNNLAAYTSSGARLPAGPGNLIDPLARKLLLLFPKPNRPYISLDDAQNSNFFVSGTDSNSNNQFDIKIDHRFNDRNLLSGKYSQRTGNGHGLNCFGNFVDSCTSGPDDESAHLLAVNFTHTFNAALLLNITYGGIRAFSFSHGVGADFKDFSSQISQLGIPSYLERSGFLAVPFIGFSNYSTSIGGQTFAILREGQDTHHLGGTVSWVKGKQELKFGGEGRLHRINFVQPGWPAGEFDFDFTSTAQFSNASDTSSGGDDMASFLMGIGPSADSAGGGCSPCFAGFNNWVSTQSFRWATFAQDNYRVTPKLILNLGLRYELSLPRTERYNRMDWLDPKLVSPIQYASQPVVVQSLPGVTPVSELHGGEVFASSKDRSNYYTDYKMIQPRIGFAYELPHKAVVRGGYGIYFSTPRSGAAGTGPWGYQGFDIQPPWITVDTNTLQAIPGSPYQIPCCRLNNPAPNGVPTPPGNLYGAFNDLGFAAVGPVRSISQHTPYEQAWSFGVQKEIPGKILLDATYVGKKGTHLYLGGFRELNHLGPDFEKARVSGQITPNDIANLVTTDQPNPFFSSSCTPTSDPRNPNFICNPNSGLSAPTIARYQLYLPYPQFTGFQGDSPPIANSIYHALQIRAERAFSNGLQFLVTYTFSKSIDSASATDDSISWLGGGTTGGGTIDVQNPNNLRAERAVSVFDIPQLLQFNYVYELPVGHGKPFGKNLQPVLNAIVGGWQTTGTWRIDNGIPLHPSLLNTTAIPTYGQRPNLTGILQRASGSPGTHVAVSGCACTSYFANDSALSDPDPYTLGTAPRTITSVRQPGTRLAGLALLKEFPITAIREGTRLEFRAEAFNAFNHPQFGPPSVTVDSSRFGKIRRMFNDPRELQLGLKLYF